MIYCSKCKSTDTEASVATRIFYCYECGHKENLVLMRESKLQELFNTIDELKQRCEYYNELNQVKNSA